MVYIDMFNKLFTVIVQFKEAGMFSKLLIGILRKINGYLSVNN